jgi:hypothetical protein
MLVLHLWLALSPLSAAPAPLACLVRHYATHAVHDARGWWAELPDGQRIPYDDGRAKTPEERLEAPDVKDLFATRYHRGPIRPVTTVDEDPGRARLDALFSATYPRAALTRARLFGRRLTVHEKVAGAFARVEERLARARAADPSIARFFTRLGGTFAPRNIAGTDRPSAHSWGVSIDLDPSLSHYWRWQRPQKPIRWQNRVPQSIVDAFEAEGFIWGGRWYHYDTMHFEYRPELLDASCYPADPG